MKTGRERHEFSVEQVRSALAAGRAESETALIVEAWRLAEASSLPADATAGGPSKKRALSVAKTLAELQLDHETIAAAILRDVVGGTSTDQQELTPLFGAAVVGLVAGLAKMDAIQDYQTAARSGREARVQKEAVRRLFLAMAEDIRVMLIKLADRLYAMRTLASFPGEQREELARESLDLYSALANRLGIGRIRWELEDLAFHCLDPDTYKKIARLLDERRVDRERNVAAAVERVGDELKKAGVEGEVSGRAKHIHSIWRKMTRKGVDFDRIFDVSAVRVLTPDVTACYAALGVVHALWRPIRGEFDDYIANPKDNGYRALHTAVIGPNGKNLEVQIRTYEMHQEAELGVAAHWSYKEGARQDVELQRRIASLRKALEVPDENGELRDLRSEAFLDRVYVLTPKGKVMELPRGATPLDFAYHVHSEIGHRCKGAKVDGKLVTLDYILKTGDRVEIMTSRQAAPSREWLNPHVGYLKTVRARAKVRQWFRTQDYDRNVASGRTLLDRELQRLGLSSLNLEKLAQRLGKDRVDDMLEALGRGGISPGQLAAVLAEQQPPALRAPDKPLELPATRVAQGVGGIHILGVDNLLTASAGCCQPVPGDPIGGYITRGRGVTIHRRSCPNLGRLERENPERLIRVEWSAKPGDLFQVEIEVVAHERPGLTKAMTAVLAEQHINVMALDSRSDPKRGLVSSVVTLQIGSIDQIGEALAEISQLPGVVEVRRRTVG